MRSILTCIFLCLLPTAITGCGSSPRELGSPPTSFFTDVTKLIDADRYDEAAKLLETTDVDTLVQDALSIDDRRFLAVVGYALELPGLPANTPPWEHPHWVLPGTTDVIVSESHGRWLDAARQFAEAYNRRLYKELLK